MHFKTKHFCIEKYWLFTCTTAKQAAHLHKIFQSLPANVKSHIYQVQVSFDNTKKCTSKFLKTSFRRQSYKFSRQE